MTDREWFTQLYDQWFKRVDAYLVASLSSRWKNPDKSEINDLTQEVFVTLWRKRAALRVHPNIGGWIIKTATNNLRNYCATKQTRGQYLASSIDEETPDGLQVALDKASLAQDRIIQDRERKHEKLEEIRRLIGNDAFEMLLDYYSRGGETARMAEENGLTPSGLRMRVKRIIDRLKRAGINMMFSFLA